MKFKFGTDPEFFFMKNNEFISAHGILPGTKHEPFKLDKGAVQVDGMAAEFNIDPAQSAEEFDNNISVVLTQVAEIVRKHDKDIRFVFTPYAKFDQDYFNLQPLESKILGCDPDFDIHGDQKVPPEDLMFSPFRTAAGHFHIGFAETDDPYNQKHLEKCKFISKNFLGAQFFVPRTPLEKERIKYYGAEGSLRPKTYGVELRTPSNLWVASSKFRRKMFNNAAKKMSEIEHAL